ncbi:hypothetical protein DUNSADRAFT_8954 [Dunaliella salina]|uniref:Encoded protein n=1 Tax=Dunaliella salina TaxID=3046 RepID=A0ABQ7GIM8_DUNSA|nr:hypothetical protein DUNSADRAFT_8954 [Dunaliella salina]|eukprot:KAF5834399.1 hypothetical protein DUNSADRAFT_8954 [Dunaliella salina]
MKRTRRSSGRRQAAKDEDKRDKKRQAWAGDQEGPRESGAEHSSASEGADLGEWIRPALGGLQQQEQQQQLLLQHEQEQQEQEQQEQQEQEQQQHGRPGLAPNPRGVQLAPQRRASLSRRIPVTVPVAESGQPQQGHEPEPLQGTALPQASIQPSTSTFQYASEPIPPMQIHIKWASATGKTKITELPLKMVGACGHGLASLQVSGV